MSGRHVRSESEAASKEIVAIRGKLAEIEQGLESIPGSAAEAISALKDRRHDLQERMAELQDLFADHGEQQAPNPEDGPPADRSLIPPLF